MTPEEFVTALRELAVERVALDEVSVLRKPPGRSPWPVLVARSSWFNGLDSDDQEMVADVIKASAFAAIFSVCAILDGVAAFDTDNGSLRLAYVAPNGDETVLNDPHICELHAELRGDGPPP